MLAHEVVWQDASEPVWIIRLICRLRLQFSVRELVVFQPGERTPIRRSFETLVLKEQLPGVDCQKEQ